FRHDIPQQCCRQSPTETKASEWFSIGNHPNRYLVGTHALPSSVVLGDGGVLRDVCRSRLLLVVLHRRQRLQNSIAKQSRRSLAASDDDQKFRERRVALAGQPNLRL